jgi:hypothetical protein
VAENRPTIEAVYGYYARLFLEHPELEWAGLASMVGPAFYAGFRDLGLVPDAARRAVALVFGRMARSLARRAAGDLGFYETTLLTMQKKIFEDQATMHEAFLAGGVGEVERLYRARIVDAATLDAWRQIDAGRRDGDASLVHRGNRTLLFREQHDIIDRFYVRMMGHRPEGPAFTYLLTLIGSPSVPGARSYPERFPLTVLVRLGGGRILAVRTPLAEGNIAVFANRWRLIEEDTLPDWLRLLAERGGEVRAMVATPIGQRVRAFRLVARVGQLVGAAASRWRVSVGPAAAAAPGGAPLGPPAAAAARPVGLLARRPIVAAQTAGDSVDLRAPPDRGSAGLPDGGDSRVWMRADREPFDFAVSLPGEREYRASAEMAVLLASVPGGDPDRLTVQLPLADVDVTERLLAGYAGEWGFPAEAVAGWRAGAERRVDSDRDYSTHVFTPAEVGFVHLELQVAHHVRERRFTVTALFAWGAAIG